MKINNTPTHLNFKSIRYRYSHYEDCYGITRETQNTTCVREDLDCHELAKIIKKNFKNIDKLSLKPMNASDLTETYAVTSALIDAFGFKTVQEKFSPILATDVDSYIINKFGKKGVIGLTPKDETQIGKKNIKKFFEKISQEPFKEKNDILYFPDTNFYKTKPEFSSLFKTEQMDLQKRLHELKDSGNSIILIRNCLAQSFGEFGTMFVLTQLEEKLKDGSLLVIGDYDRKNLRNLVSDLKEKGFYEIGINIFRKGKPSTISKINYFLTLFKSKFTNFMIINKKNIVK